MNSGDASIEAVSSWMAKHGWTIGMIAHLPGVKATWQTPEPGETLELFIQRVVPLKTRAAMLQELCADEAAVEEILEAVNLEWAYGASDWDSEQARR